MSDLIPARVYAIPDRWWAVWEIRPDGTSLPGHRLALERDSPAYTALEQHRVAGPPELRELLEARVGTSPLELWCEERAPTPTTPTSAHLSRCYATRTGEKWTEQLVALLAALRPAAAVLTAFGLLVMWRAPGERGSVAAAIWAFGYASALSLVVPVTDPASFTSLDALVMQWGLTPQSQSALVRHVYVVLRGLMAFALALGMLAVSGILATSVIVAWTWPPDRSSDGIWIRRSVVLRLGVIVLAPVAAFAAVGYALSLIANPWGAAMEAAAFGLLVSIPILVPFAVAWLVHRYAVPRITAVQAESGRSSSTTSVGRT